MTESREPGDRDAKRRKIPDVQQEKPQEKVREKPNEVSEEGTPMDLTPSQADENPESELREVEVKTEHEEVHSEIGKQGTEVVAGDTEGTLPFRKREDGDDDISAKKTVNRQEEEDLKRAIELSKESLMLPSMGLNPNAPGSTSSDMSTSEFEFESSSTGRSSSYEEVDSNSEEVAEGPDLEPEGLPLFDMEIPRSNWLVITAKPAKKYLPKLPPYCKSNMEVELKILDCHKQEWGMRLVNYIEENVYLISKGWYEFTERHNLYPTDVITFYTPLDLDHYVIKFSSLGETVFRIPEYARGDLLFELELQLDDNGDMSTLSLPTTDVETHFPAVKMVPGTSHTKQIVKFTDVHSKHWYMEITLDNGTAYMITYGWEHFVGEYQLEATDRIMFYMPAQQLHAKHFLIRYVKKKVGERSEDENPSRLSHQAKGKQKVIDF